MSTTPVITTTTTAATATTGSRYAWSCKDCEWCGQCGRYDMYLCASHGGGSIIAVHSDADYASFPLFVMFRPTTDELSADDGYRACAKTALDLCMTGRILVRFEVRPRSQ